MVQFLRLLDISPLDILPQRPPFVLIDRLTHYDETSAKTCLTVREDNLFVENGRMLATGLVENMAQTCAARLGYYNLVSGLPVRVGVIGAVSKLHVRREPLTGERLDTTMTVREEMFGVTLADVEIRVGEEVIATAGMKIAIQ